MPRRIQADPDGTTTYRPEKITADPGGPGRLPADMDTTSACLKRPYATPEDDIFWGGGLEDNFKHIAIIEVSLTTRFVLDLNA